MYGDPVTTELSSDQRVLTAIRTFMLARSYPPSVRELSADVGLSLAATHEAMRRLVRDGKIQVVPGVSRGVVLLDP